MPYGDLFDTFGAPSAPPAPSGSSGGYGDLFDTFGAPPTAPTVSLPGGGAYQQIMQTPVVQAVSNSWVGQHLINPSISFLGKALQPLAAPQQLIFGGLGAVADLVQGRGEDALETWNRSSKAALSYATWGGYNYGGQDPRTRSILGYDLLKKVGAPEAVAKWGGVGADFFLDVPLVGAVGKATGASKWLAAGTGAFERGVKAVVSSPGRAVQTMTANVALGNRIASYFDSAADYAAYTLRVAQAPFTTQPIKRLYEDMPQGLQDTLSNPVKRLLETRLSVPRDQSQAVGPSVGEFWIGANYGQATPVTDARRLGAHLESQYTTLYNQAVNAFGAAAKGLSAGDKGKLDVLVGQLTETASPSARAQLEGQVRALETSSGQTGLFERAVSAVGRGVAFDVWSAQNLGRVGLMGADEVAQYVAGDKRHLRRLFALYGEKPEQQIARLMDRNLPGEVRFEDPAKLEAWMADALNRVGTTGADPKAWAGAFKAAYTSVDTHPAEAMKRFLEEQGVVGDDLAEVLMGVGQRYGDELGIRWKPSDRAAATYFAQKLNSGALTPSGAGRGGLALGVNPTAVGARAEITPEYADLLGQIEGFTQRIEAQGRTVGRTVSRTATVQGIRQYLTDNDLIQQMTADNLHSTFGNAGLRAITPEMERALGNGFKDGELIPSGIHRILADATRVKDEGALSAAWQWMSSRWQGLKLANPSSILTNVKSGFVMADQYGLSVPKLLEGMRDYVRLHRAGMKGDGALDTSAQVNGVTLREMFDAGDFTHNTLFQREVTDQAGRMLESLANNKAGGLPAIAAGIQSWLTTPVGAAVGGTYSTLSAPLKWMGDLYGRTDSLFKGGAYMMLRRQGRSSEEAARAADEVFFNYNHGLPYVVDLARKGGLIGLPFFSFKMLAAGRFARNLYERPYQTARYYRIPSSLAADKTAEEQEALVAGSPGFVRAGLYVFAGKDSEGRTRALRMDDLLPESVLTDTFNGDNVTALEPPVLGLWRQIINGQGYQGMPTFKGGANLQDTMRANPQEAIRGTLKALWQFGASPLAPGQASTERLVKSLVGATVPLEAIPDPKVQAAMKLLADGPTAPLNPAVIGVEKRGTQPVPDLIDALARYVSVKTTLVTPTSGAPGSARSNLQALEAQIALLDKQMSDELRQAVSDGQKAEVRARYARMRNPLVAQLRDTAGKVR